MKIKEKINILNSLLIAIKGDVNVGKTGCGICHYSHIYDLEKDSIEKVPIFPELVNLAQWSLNNRRITGIAGIELGKYYAWCTDGERIIALEKLKKQLKDKENEE